MTRIYLDVHDRVRFDTTPDNREARSATFNRGLLKMGDLLATMAVLRAKQRELLGIDATGVQQHLRDIRAIQNDIRAEA